MNKRQVAKLNMGKAVKKLCDENQAAINTVPAFADVVKEFSILMDNFVSYATGATKKIQGVTQEKHSQKLELARLTAGIAGILFAYASKNNNLVLMDASKVSKTELKRLPDNELPMVCGNIADLAQENLVALRRFGLTEAKISQLEALIKQYTESVPNPRMAISKRKTINKNIEAAIKQINNLLHEQMDKLVVNLQEEYPDFVLTYFSDRMNINTAIRYKKAIEIEEVAKIIDVTETIKLGNLAIAI